MNDRERARNDDQRWLGLLLAVLAVFALSACSNSSPKEDARVTSCEPGGEGTKPHAAGDVENTSSKRSNFFIRVEFRDSSGNRVSEGVDSINNVEPGTTSPWNVTAIADAQGPVTCELGTVRRTVAAPS